MKVRLIRSWQGHKAGAAVEVDAGLAVELVRRGVAEAAEEASPTAHENKAFKSIRKGRMVRQDGTP